MNIITAIQARTSSSRLPNKVLFPLCGEPLLIRMIERVKRSAKSGTLVVATSKDTDNDIIESLCSSQNIACFRGNLYDLLDRHYQLAKHFEADAIVKIPSDCPLVDPGIIDRVIGYYLDNYPNYDFVSNLHPATFPDGNDVEIMSFQTLETAWKEAARNLEREHTTPYIWEHPEKFNIGNVVWESGLDYSMSHRWTIDYEEDYQFIKKVYDVLYPKNPAFGLADILQLLGQQPEIAAINHRHTGKYWYVNYMDELKTIDDYKNKLNKK